MSSSSTGQNGYIEVTFRPGLIQGECCDTSGGPSNVYVVGQCAVDNREVAASCRSELPIGDTMIASGGHDASVALLESVALVLAAVGTVALVAFVSRAEARAREGEELVEVYVVENLIPAGTPAEQIEPALSRGGTVEGAARQASTTWPTSPVRSPASIWFRVSSCSRPGSSPEPTSPTGAGVDVPDDKIEITIALDPERAIGGLILPGDTVAVFASFEPFDLNANVVEVDGEEVPLPARSRPIHPRPRHRIPPIS